jgi:hypothetical protein
MTHKRSRNTEIQEFMHGDKTNLEYEMYDKTGNNWSHPNNSKKFKKNFEIIP